MQFVTLNLFEETYGGIRYVSKISIVPSQICSLRKSDKQLSEKYKREILFKNPNLSQADIELSELTLADGTGILLVAESEAYIKNLLS